MEMTTKHFVIFGAGVIAGYLLFDYLRKNPMDSTTEQSGDTGTSPGTPGGSPIPLPTPPIPPIPTPPTDDYTYEVLENFSVEYYNSSTNNNWVANFTQGQIIHAKPIFFNDSVGALVTTPEGNYPSMTDGTPTVILPENKIQRIL